MPNKKYYPKKDEDGRFYWQSAYIDAFANHYTIPAHLYELLIGARIVDRNYLRKTFDKYDDAISSLERALEIIHRSYEEYSK